MDGSQVVERFGGRREDRRLLTGAGAYTADRNRPGQVYGVFLRADRAHAGIVGMELAGARGSPGVLAVLTAAEMLEAGFTRGRAQMPFKGPHGELRTVGSPALSDGRVRYVGEPVVLVVAETAHQAADAAEAVVVEYDDLPAVVDAAAALAEGAALLHEGVPGNLCFDYPYGDAAAVEAAFAGAAHVVRLEMTSPRVVGNPMEPKAAIAEWDGEVLELYSPSQGSTSSRDAMAGLLGMPGGRIRNHARDVGGAFGIRGAAYPEYAALALAARVVGRPVKWVASRSETFLSDYHGRAVRMTAELALDAEGRFLAIRHDWVCDVGAFPSAAGASTNVMNSSIMASGAYRIPAVSGRTRVAVTNTVPITAYRGAGRPDMAYAVERVVEAAAHRLGMDPLELRRRNVIPREAFPYKVSTAPMPTEYDSADFPALMETAERESDWAGFAGRRAEAEARGRLRGLGCAVFIEPSGGVSAVDEAALTFGEDGRILLHEVAVASGQGHETVFPELAARVLQVDPMRIELRGGDADSPALKGAGAFGSRSMMSQGSVCAEVARVVVRKGTGLAAEVLEAAEADIEYADGAWRVAGTDRGVTLEELVRLRPGALDSTAGLASPRAFPSGAHVAEVEVDPDTGVVELVRYVSIDDCGVVVNRTLVEGQIWGGLLQGLGQVFGEDAVYGEDGQLVAGSFMDYPMPRAELVPRVAIRLVPVASPGNGLGAKGVGEAGTVGSLPTAMNAVVDALRSAGVAGLDMPATPRRVWEALAGAGR